MRAALAARMPAARARRIAGPRPWCSSSGVMYPIAACRRTVLYSAWMRASSLSSAAGSRDAGEMRPVAFQMAEETLDVRLIRGRSGPAVMLGDRHQRQELAGVDRGHLRSVIRPRHEGRRVPRVVVGWDPVGPEQPLVLERLGEQQLRLGRGLLGREQVADPVASDDVEDRVGNPLGTA